MATEAVDGRGDEDSEMGPEWAGELEPEGILAPDEPTPASSAAERQKPADFDTVVSTLISDGFFKFPDGRWDSDGRLNFEAWTQCLVYNSERRKAQYPGWSNEDFLEALRLIDKAKREKAAHPDRQTQAMNALALEEKLAVTAAVDRVREEFDGRRAALNSEQGLREGGDDLGFAFADLDDKAVGD